MKKWGLSLSVPTYMPTFNEQKRKIAQKEVFLEIVVSPC